ncbi:MAG TPA: hypothetical protein VM915_00845 [Verrucomicrobiae bacterium]|jgi:hypothetical protein|nr:hypothetical protein [Verrucomicrobiae bacterium]
MKRLNVAAAIVFALATSPAAFAQIKDRTASPADMLPAASEIALTNEFLVGAWGDNGDCTAPIIFNIDGTYLVDGDPGRWTLVDDIITFSGDGGVFQVRARVLNDRQIQVHNPNGAIGLSQRC